MCGIFGVIVSAVKQCDLCSAVTGMQTSLAHRGPDDNGTIELHHEGLILGHTRLSILDLSEAGHQPMQDRETGNWVVFNGEIYNFKSLREELGVRGEGQGSRSEPGDENFGFRNADFGFNKHRNEVQSSVSGHQSPVGFDWKSNSDTEVILRAYAKWGKDCVTRFRGMFAFAIWDEREKELFLARDPFGIKPLYYYQTSDTFLFASELRALLASELVPRKLSQQGLASYLQFGSVQDPLTILDNVHSLLPGHGLVVKRSHHRIEVKELSFPSPPANGVSHMADSVCQEPADGVSRVAYGPTVTTTSHDSSHMPHAISHQLSTVSNKPKSRDEAVRRLRSVLEESVRAHLVSDVPVAAFLSGGIDSSAIVALMRRECETIPRTFSVTFEESDFSEGEHARLIASKFGTEHHEILLPEARLLEMLPEALQAMDRPTMDGVNTYVVSKAVHDAGVKVALSGLGGDELFAGYPSFQRALRFQRLSHMPSAIRSYASKVGHLALNGSARNRKFWDMVGSDCSPFAAYSLSRQLFSPNEISSLMRDQRPEVRGQRSEVRSQSCSQLHAPCSMHPIDPINEVSLLELTGYMQNTLLRDTDQMSMAHALEVRVPFVDSRVVNYVMNLPGEWKVDGNRPKPLLVDALGDLLPEEIWKRRKMGFTLPFQRWMQAGLRGEIESSLADGKMANLGLNQESVGKIWSAFNENPKQEAWSRSWALYVLARWAEVNRVTA